MWQLLMILFENSEVDHIEAEWAPHCLGISDAASLGTYMAQLASEAEVERLKVF
jgi:hypothetical protein